jgi:hypothetical protein
MSEFDPTEMENEDLEIDFSDQSERPQWKAGDVELYVSGYEVGNSQNSGRKQITWTLRAPSVNNFTVKHYTGLDKEGVWSTEQIVVSLGIGKPGEKIVLSKRKTLGLRLMAKIELQKYNGKNYPKIKKCMPHPDGPVDPNAAPF